MKVSEKLIPDGIVGYNGNTPMIVLDKGTASYPSFTACSLNIKDYDGKTWGIFSTTWNSEVFEYITPESLTPSQLELYKEYTQDWDAIRAQREFEKQFSEPVDYPIVIMKPLRFKEAKNDKR